MKFNNKIISSFILCLCINFTIQTGKFQAIWVIGEGTTSETSALMWAKDYLVIKTKFFIDQVALNAFNPPSGDNHRILIRRSDTLNAVPSITTNPTSPPNEYYKYKYYVPSIELDHTLPFVIYDIELNHCAAVETSCDIKYKMKFFSCSENAMDFFDDLSDTDALLVLSSSNTEPKKVQLTSQFTDEYSIYDLLTGASNLNCQVTSDNDCCNPYPCTIDSSSLQCICRLEGNTAGPGALTAGVCQDYQLALTQSMS